MALVAQGRAYLTGAGSLDGASQTLPAIYDPYMSVDFNDITVDKVGRVLIGYSDGCTGTCVSYQTKPCSDAACSTGPTASTDHLASIAREYCGIGLIDTYAAALACPAPALMPGPIGCAF